MLKFIKRMCFKKLTIPSICRSDDMEHRPTRDNYQNGKTSFFERIQQDLNNLNISSNKLIRFLSIDNCKTKVCYGDLAWQRKLLLLVELLLLPSSSHIVLQTTPTKLKSCLVVRSFNIL